MLRVLLLIFCSPLVCLSQGEINSHSVTFQIAGAVKSAQSVDGKIPTHTLNFDSGEQVHGLTASPLIALPTQCTSNGVIYLDMLDPADPRKHSFVGIDDKSWTSFSTASITTVKDIEVVGVSVTPSMFSVLVKGKKSDSAVAKIDSDGTEYAYRIARFDPIGTYKGVVGVPLSGSIIRFASFASGEALILRLDDGKSVPELILLDADGKLLRVLETPQMLIQNSRSAVGSNEHPYLEELNLLGSVLMLPFKEGVLLWRAGSTGPILSVLPNGSVTLIPVKFPDGIRGQSFRMRVRHIILRSIPITKLIFSMAAYINELRPVGASMGTIACEHDGIYESFHTDVKQQFFRSEAR